MGQQGRAGAHRDRDEQGLGRGDWGEAERTARAEESWQLRLLLQIPPQYEGSPQCFAIEQLERATEAIAKFSRLMSALGQRATSSDVRLMSPLPLRADIGP